MPDAELNVVSYEVEADELERSLHVAPLVRSTLH